MLYEVITENVVRPVARRAIGGGYLAATDGQTVEGIAVRLVPIASDAVLRGEANGGVAGRANLDGDVARRHGRVRGVRLLDRVLPVAIRANRP